MNPPRHYQPDESLSPPEQTLRMLAKLPPPDGLSARVQASLRTAPRRSSFFSFGNVFGLSGWQQIGALRTVAAFGIVCVVAGGGWQIYSHVQTAPGTQGSAVPVHVNAGESSQGSFSTSGAIAKPDPLKAPVITHQIASPALMNQPQPIVPAKKSSKKKPEANAAPVRPEQR